MAYTNKNTGMTAWCSQNQLLFISPFLISMLVAHTGLFLESNFMKIFKSSEPGFHCLHGYAILPNHLYGLQLLCPKSFFCSVKISWRYFSKLPNLKICPAYQPPSKVEEKEESEGERKILHITVPFMVRQI